MILCILPVGFGSAQTNETISTTKVQDAPAWFFNPSKGEYAGVSLPLKNYELARQQAIYSALLSYVAQNETTVTIHGATKSCSNTQGDKVNSKLESNYKCTFSLTDQYRVVETAVNQYGEVFILIKVTDTGSNSAIRVVVRLSENYENRDGVVKDERQLIYALADSSLLPSAEVSVYGKNVTLNDQITVNMQIKRASKYSSARETVEPEAKYQYQSTNGKIDWLSTGGFYSPVQHSLGLAYTTALLNCIMDDCRRIAEKSALHTGKISDNENSGSSQIMNQTITKPARALKAEIEDDDFCFMSDFNVFLQEEPSCHEYLKGYEELKQKMDSIWPSILDSLNQNKYDNIEL